MAWQLFTQPADLGHQVQHLLIGHLIRAATRYRLTATELRHLEKLLTKAAQDEPPLQAKGAGHSAVILSRERFRPDGGVIIGE